MGKFVLAVVLIVCGLLAAETGDPAQADQGVSIDLGSISIDEKLSPGGRYRLPTLTVRNIGDQEGDYEVVVAYLNGAGGSNAPEGWFDFEPKQFHLIPQEARLVQVHIELPSGVDPGRYNALIEARVEPEGEGVRLSAAAASRVSFEVKPSSLLEAWVLQLSRSLEDRSPWSYLVIGVLTLLSVVYLSRRFLRLRLGIERRR